jgi:hypothetical protein
MRDFVRASAFLGVLAGASCALATAAVGCGGDDSNINPDASDGNGGEAKADVTTDHSMVDVFKGDASTDSPSNHDADAATDSPTDAPADNAALYAFPHAADLAYCQRLESCCLLDGGSFGAASCATDLDQSGGAFGNIGIANVHSGHITFDPAQAKSCVSGISGIDCATLTATLTLTLTGECAGAMIGTVSAGGPCSSAFDCKTGLYCAQGAGDAGAQCAALKTLGETCSDLVFSTDCSYLGNGTPALFCQQNADGGLFGTCQPSFSNGVDCQEYEECATLICDYSQPTPVCSDSTPFSQPGVAGGICTDYPPDGGP